MSSALVWHLIRDNNSFLVKRGRANRSGAVQFSSEPGNLLNVNTYKYSGIANENSIDISKDLVAASKAPLSNKPVSSTTIEKLSLHSTKSLAKLQAILASSNRTDLTSAAKIRLLKIQKDLRVRKGLSKKVAKSGKRGLKKL